MTVLTADELLAWLEHTTTCWREFLAAHPEALDLPCDVRESSRVADLLRHIVAVELRYAERLAGLPATSYDDLPCDTVEAVFAVHDRAMALLREAMAATDTDWEEVIEFQTRSAGLLRASRRTVLVHAATHSIRHYAQLATLLRQLGLGAGLGLDYLYMGLV